MKILRYLTILTLVRLVTPEVSLAQNNFTAPPLSITWVRTNPPVNGLCKFDALNQFNYTTGQYWGCLPLDNPSVNGFNVGGWKPISAPEVVGYGSALPTFCTIGRVFYLTTATPGANVYGCTALNTWTAQGGTGSGTVGAGTAGQLAYYATTGTAVSGETTVTAAQFPALTGDVTTPLGSLATTLATVNSGSGLCGDATHVCAVTTNAKGLTTTQSAVPITFPAVVHSPSASFDGGGLPLTVGTKAYTTVPYGCSISAWDATVDTGTITLDVWKLASGTAIPTVANTITAAALPAIASGTAARSTTLTGWTTAVTANDIFGFNVSAVSGATKASLVLQCQ